MAKNISPLTKFCLRSIQRRGGLTFSATCALTLLLSGAAQSLEPKWPAEPYRYLIVDQDVRDILTEFGRNLNMSVKVSDAVNGRRIRGKLPITGAKDFLNRLCESYGLVWYFDGAVLHVSADSEVRTELIDLGTVNHAGMNERLQALGVTDSRYQVRGSPDSRVLSVSGPPAYLALVRQTVATLQKAKRPLNIREVPDGDELRVRVFRGKSEGS